MKVSKKLLKSLEVNPDSGASHANLLSLLEEININTIVLPKYQTVKRWDQKKDRDLLNYILGGKAPISAISMHEVGADDQIEYISYIDRLNDIDRKKVKWTTIDGQQRLTCLLYCYINHEESKDIVLDLKKGHFIINSNEFKKHCQVPAGILLNRDITILKEYCASRDELKSNYDTISDTRHKFFRYKLTLNVAKDMNIDEQIDWFIKLNNAGSTIPELQLILTALNKYGIDVYAEYTSVFKEILRSVDMEESYKINSSEISAPIAVLNAYMEVEDGRKHNMNWSPITSDHRAKVFVKKNKEYIQKAFKVTLDTLRVVANFIKDKDINIANIDYKHVNFITSMMIYREFSKINLELEEKLIEWINSTDFTNRTNREKREIYNKLLSI